MLKKICLFFIIFFFGCDAPCPPPHKIALVVPLTGPLSYWGRMCEKGARLRLRDEKIILKSFDNKGESKITKQIFDKIIMEDFLVAIGPLSCKCLNAILPKIKEGHLPTISLGCFKGMKKDCWAINLLTEKQEASAIMSYLREEKIKRWALIYEDGLWERDLINFIIKGKMDKPIIIYKISEKDLPQCIDILKSTSPDVIVFIGLPKIAALLSIGIKRGGINAKFIGAYVLLDNEFLEMVNIRNLLICTPNLKNEEKFRGDFIRHYYDNPHWAAACGYAAMDLCIEAIKNRASRKAIYKFLKRQHLTKMECKLRPAGF